MRDVESRASDERLPDETHVVSVAGELDLHTVPEVERALAPNGGARGRLVIDLSECTFIDSTGLGILVVANRRCSPHSLLVVATSPEVLRVIKLTRLDRLFALHPTLESALNGVAR